MSSSSVDKDVVATWKQVTQLNMTARISQVYTCTQRLILQLVHSVYVHTSSRVVYMLLLLLNNHVLVITQGQVSYMYVQKAYCLLRVYFDEGFSLEVF